MAFSVFFHIVVISVALITTLSSFEYLEVQKIRLGEYYGLILLGTVGMCLMSSAIELVLIFIALEISSIATYVLAGFRRRAASSAEASIKYFLLGSFRHRFLPLRRCAHVRRNRFHECGSNCARTAQWSAPRWPIWPWA